MVDLGRCHCKSTGAGRCSTSASGDEHPSFSLWIGSCALIHVLRLWVGSDQHKLLLLSCSNLWACATLCLFVDFDNHPRGPNAAPPSLPVPAEMAAIWQRDASETLLQLALFDSGRVAMREQASVIKALEQVAKHGLTDDAQNYAEGALMALNDKEMSVADSGEQKHIMLSYQVRYIR